MPTHDIIDNRKEILVDHINRILSSTEAARFAVGYFFLSGLTSIADKPWRAGQSCEVKPKQQELMATFYNLKQEESVTKVPDEYSCFE